MPGTLATTVAGLHPGVALLCVAMAIVGVAIQGSIGLGMSLVMVPPLGLIDTDFVPAAVVLVAIPVTFGMSLRERGNIDWEGIRWAVVGAVPGALAGAVLTAAAGTAAVAIVVGLAVLLAVIASVADVDITPTHPNLFAAGVVSGFGAAASAIGGPPIAITYQHEDPSTLRATLAAYFTIGGLLTAALLTLTGVLRSRQLQLGLLLVPGAAIGLWITRFVIGWLPAERVRIAVLAVSAVSAAALIVEEVV